MNFATILSLTKNKFKHTFTYSPWSSDTDEYKLGFLAQNFAKSRYGVCVPVNSEMSTNSLPSRRIVSTGACYLQTIVSFKPKRQSQLRRRKSEFRAVRADYGSWHEIESPRATSLHRVLSTKLKTKPNNFLCLCFSKVVKFTFVLGLSAPSSHPSYNSM